MNLPTDERLGDRVVSPSAAASAWSALRYPVFRYHWIATVRSNGGGWMYSAASGRLMTGLNANPLVVSLVQVATSLPLFLLALPAGALRDMIDKCRFILTVAVLNAVLEPLFA